MCGILGYSSPVRPSVEFLDGFRQLFVLTQSRGTHASGVAWEREGGLGIEKLQVRAAEFLLSDGYAAFEAAAPLEAIAHTRWATQGHPSNPENNHPHHGLGGRLAVVHNGHIINWQDLIRSKGLGMRGNCDSEVIARLVERGVKKNRGLLESVKACASAVQGGATFASLLAGTGTVVYRWRNPLAWAKVGKATVFASSASDIEDAFNVQTERIEDGQAMSLKRGKVSVSRLRKPEVVKRELPCLVDDDRPGWYMDTDGRIHLSGGY